MASNDLSHSQLYLELSQYGDFYPLDIKIDVLKLSEELKPHSQNWVQYNKSKPTIKRKGLSLFSHNGETGGDKDLTSVTEYNKINGTHFTEMSFRKPTPYWQQLQAISQPLVEIEKHLGRSHLIRFNEGGFFPRHRDIGDSFRLISFLYGSPESLIFGVENNVKEFSLGRIYFANTRLSHFICNLSDYGMILVLNVELNDEAVKFVRNNLYTR